MNATRELDGYVRKKLRSGYHEGELRNELLAEGYSEPEIEQAFYNSLMKPAKTPASNPGEYPLWFFLSVGLLILGISFKSIQRGGWFSGDWTDYVLGAGIVGTLVGIMLTQFKKTK